MLRKWWPFEKAAANNGQNIWSISMDSKVSEPWSLFSQVLKHVYSFQVISGYNSSNRYILAQLDKFSINCQKKKIRFAMRFANGIASYPRFIHILDACMHIKCMFELTTASIFANRHFLGNLWKIYATVVIFSDLKKLYPDILLYPKGLEEVLAE